MTKYQSVTLSSLLGPHTLTGCEDCATHPEYPDSNSITFVLDGVTLCAIEDQEDGYRSMLGEIMVCSSGIAVANTFAPCEVIGRFSDSTESIIELVDRVTGKTVISIGTDCYDDYYPVFEGRFEPTAMAINNS